MFREIRTSERITDTVEEKKDNLNFLKIKPEYDMTFEEAEAFWENEFKKIWEES